MTIEEVRQHIGKVVYVAWPEHQEVRPVRVTGDFLSTGGWYAKIVDDDPRGGECCPAQDLYPDEASARKGVFEYCSQLAEHHRREAARWSRLAEEFK